MTPHSSERRAFSVSVFAVHAPDAAAPRPRGVDEAAVLLIRHKRLRKWLPVGGEVEANETPLEAAARELKEETGLVGDFRVPSRFAIPGTPPGLLAYEEHEAGAKGLHLNFVFAARVPSRVVKGDGSFTDHAWVREAPEDAPGNVRVAVELARAAVSG